MSGPIIRVGATPEFAAAWDRVFGKKEPEAPAASAAPAPAEAPVPTEPPAAPKSS